MSSEKNISPPKNSNRRKLFKLHSWIGFHLALIMFVVLATGTISTLTNEIDWLIQDDMRVTPSDEHVPWHIMTEAIETYDPAINVHRIQKMPGDYLAYRATVTNTQGSRKYMHVNQWTGEVTGTTGLLTVQRFFRDLHRYLFMPSIIGLPIVASMAFILMISLYTGLKTSRNWRTLMTRVRTDKGSRVLIGDAHKAAGLWSTWFFVLMIATGIWYLAELGAAVGARFGGQSFEPNRPTLSTERVESFGDVINIRSTEAILAATKEFFPELEVTEIAYPLRTNQGITVLGDRTNPILRSRANRIFFDPETLEPMKIQRSENIRWVAWINEIADPLHFGYFGGLITKIIWFIFGLAMTGLSATGVWLTWCRLKTKAITRTQFATMPVLMIAALVGYFDWYQNYNTTEVETPSPEVVLPLQTNGEISVTANLGLLVSGKSDGSIRLLVKGDNGWPNLKKVTLFLGDNENKKPLEIATKIVSLGKTFVAKSNIETNQLSAAETISAKIILNSGRHFILTWPLNGTDKLTFAGVKA